MNVTIRVSKDSGVDAVEDYAARCRKRAGGGRDALDDLREAVKTGARECRCRRQSRRERARGGLRVSRRLAREPRAVLQHAARRRERTRAHLAVVVIVIVVAAARPILVPRCASG